MSAAVDAIAGKGGDRALQVWIAGGETQVCAEGKCFGRALLGNIDGDHSAAGGA